MTIIACAYHNDGDEVEIKSGLKDMILKNRDGIHCSVGNELHPFLRRVLLFVKKK